MAAAAFENLTATAIDKPSVSATANAAIEHTYHRLRSCRQL